MNLLADGLPVDLVRGGKEIAAIDQYPDRVEAKTADGEVFAGCALVGADGVRSSVRRLVFDGKQSQRAVLDTASWRFMVHNPGVECWTLWVGRRGMALLIPVDGDQAYGWATIRDPAANNIAALESAFADFPTPVRQAIASAVRAPAALHHSPIEEVRMDSWIKDRVLLLGDAAHATAPVWAQGAALAMEDALALSEAVSREASWNAATVNYEAIRRPRVTHVQKMTDRLSRSAKLPVRLRNAIMPFIGPKTYTATYALLREQ